MSIPISGIDHAVIGVRDLEAAAAAWRRLGFTTTPRGRHIGWGTANYCMMFGADYIELLGIVDPAEFTNNLDRFLATREGLLSVAFATADADAVAAALARQDLAAEGPKDLGRLIELPEGAVTPRFKLVMLAPDTTPGLSAFVCQHLSPELMRRAAWLDHANGARAIRSLSAVVADPPSLAEPYERIFGAGAATLTDDTLAVRTGGATLLFASRDDLFMLHPGVEAPAATPPYLAAMTLSVADPARVASHLGARGISFATDPDGAIRVGPEVATGVILEFRAGG